MTSEQKTSASIDALRQQTGWRVLPLTDATLALERVDEGQRSEMTGGAAA